jgi:hypothetical protein
MDAMVDGIERMREVQHAYDPSCTTRIGSETDGVVDNELRVYQPTSSVKATERESI